MSGLEGLLTGQTLVNRYRIQEVVGRGGFAAVYRALDERLGRQVAVKVITIATPDPEAAAAHRERFEREARAAASLPQHPNVVTVHDFGVDPGLGLDFLVMEFLHGEDLATWLRRLGRPELELALRILCDAASGIAVGHRAGIVHRDVKPGNIFLAQSESGEELRVCILDFGIARLTTEDQTLTGFPGEGIPLSPAYASPEQTRGEQELTPASDVFSLGVVAYQLLTGEKPFSATRRPHASDWLPRRSIRDLNPTVPEGVERAVQRALAYEPVDRFGDAEDFAAALVSPSPEDVTILAPVSGAPPHVTPPPTGPDHTVAQSEPEPFVFRDPQNRAITGQPDSRRLSIAGPIVFVLLLATGGLAGWWYLSGGTDAPAPVDASAVSDLEVVAEDLETPDPPDGGASPRSTGAGSRLPGQIEIVPFGASPESVPPLGTTAADSVFLDTTTIPPADSTSVDPSEAEADTAATLPDTALPPPRVIGTPVDSLRPSADEGAEPNGSGRERPA